MITPQSQAMIHFSPKRVMIKTEQTLELTPAKTKDEIDSALHLIQKRFPHTSHIHEYQEICAYLRTPEGLLLVGAANFLYPTSARPYLQLANIVVDEEFQDKGIGTAILTYLLENTNCAIQLYSLNEKTTYFYKKHGFYSYDPLLPNKMRRNKKEFFTHF
jgi:N-acetylglutamate synthase-like GNAT family acetyltransferase